MMRWARYALAAGTMLAWGVAQQPGGRGSGLPRHTGLMAEFAHIKKQFWGRHLGSFQNATGAAD
jgi:hypothetical protein